MPRLPAPPDARTLRARSILAAVVLATSALAPLVAPCFVVGCAPQGNGDSHAARGDRLYERREFATAIQEFEKALDLPLRAYTRSELLTSIGNCYSELNRFDESMAYHDRAIDEDPSNHRAYVNKGVVHRLLGEYDQAASMYSKALELDPEYAELHASVGALAFFREDFQGAIIHFERAIELDHTLAVAHSNLAMAYAEVGRFDDADNALGLAVEWGYHQPEVIEDHIETLRSRSRSHD